MSNSKLKTSLITSKGEFDRKSLIQSSLEINFSNIDQFLTAIEVNSGNFAQAKKYYKYTILVVFISLFLITLGFFIFFYFGASLDWTKRRGNMSDANWANYVGIIIASMGPFLFMLFSRKKKKDLKAEEERKYNNAYDQAFNTFKSVLRSDRIKAIKETSFLCGSYSYEIIFEPGTIEIEFEGSPI